MKRRLLCVACVLIALLLCACARTPNLTKPAMAEGAKPFEVSGECEAALQDGGSSLQVSGTCNLMDGTNGIIRILSAEGSKLAEQKFTKEGETISHSFEVKRDWPDVLYGFISFDTQTSDSQPKEVLEAYGKRFENLEGENVIWDLKGVIAVFQSEPVVHA